MGRVYWGDVGSRTSDVLRRFFAAPEFRKSALTNELLFAQESGISVNEIIIKDEGKVDDYAERCLSLLLVRLLSLRRGSNAEVSLACRIPPSCTLLSSRGHLA